MSNEPLAESTWTAIAERRRAIVVKTTPPCHWLLDTPRLKPVAAMATRIAAWPTTRVIISGERGVGVGELARLIHDQEKEGRRRFVSLPAHKIGTGEVRGGVFEGTLVIEDIENLRPPAQTWLKDLVTDLDSAFRPLRVIATSQLSVDGLLACPQLNQELIHALDVMRLEIPPLRQRPEEIVPLAQRYLAHFSAAVGKPLNGFSSAAQGKLTTHPYPANVRELRNVVERAIALEESNEIQEEAIVFHNEAPQAPVQTASPMVPKSAPMMATVHLPSLSEVERDYLIALIRQLGGKRTAISRVMGISYPTVIKKIAHHGLDVRAILAKDRATDSSNRVS